MTTEAGYSPEDFQDAQGFYVLYLFQDLEESLYHILNRRVPWVYLYRYTPVQLDAFKWTSTALPLRKDGTPKRMLARLLNYDLLMPTEEFLGVLDEIADNGLSLYQCQKEVKPTLNLDTLPQEKEREILVKCGFTCGYVIPHPGEVSQYWTNDRDHFATLLNKPEVMKHAILTA